MTRRTRAGRLWTLLLIANIVFIWGNSMLPGSESQQLSDGFLRYLSFLLAPLGAYASLVVRKAAHFLEFACLGFLLTGFFRMRGRAPFVTAALCGLLSACADETIQMFSPGRASRLTDVWIDFAGVLTGIFLLRFGHILWKKTRKTHNSEEN